MALADSLLKQGLAHHEAGRLAEAERLYRRALTKAPRHPWAHGLMGSLLQDQGRFEEALAAFDRALKHEPGYIEAAFNSGNVLLRLGRNEEAAARFERAIALRPGYAKACCGLGQARQRLHQPEAAEAAYRQALASHLDFAEAHANLASLLRETSRLDEAEASFNRALQINPRLAEALNGLGELLQMRGRLEQAEGFLRQALSIDPDYPDALNTLGVLLLEQGRLDEAENRLERAIELAPEMDMFLSNLGAVHAAQGNIGRAEDAYRRAMAIAPSSVTHSNLIFLTDFDEHATTSSQQEERRRWNDRHAAPLKATWRAHGNNRDPDRRLRIGYVSADFRMHSAAFAFVPMLRHYDRERFEVFCYSNSARADQMTKDIRGSVDAWRNILCSSDEEAATMIRADGIDVLVDLSSHSAGNRLLMFARRPAPVQMTGWGHANGTGLEAMDYLFSDLVSIPSTERHHYAEQILDLPCQIPYVPPVDAPPASPLPAARNGFVTFGCFNRLAKMSENNLDAWAKILKKLPDARLILKAKELDDPAQRARVSGLFAQRGIDRESLTLVGKTSWREHMQYFHEVDIALDPFPHGGGISTYEALWMGCPVVTLAGSTLASRIAAAIETGLGLEDWVAADERAYVGLAAEKAGNLGALKASREALRARFMESPLGDPAKYAAAVEDHYRRIWKEWCGKDAPEAHPDRPHAPDDPIRVAEALERDGQHEKAAESYKRMLESSPGHPEAWEGLVRLGILFCNRIHTVAKTEQERCDATQAVDCFRIALQHRKTPALWVNLAAAHGCLGDYQAEEAYALEGLKGDSSIAEGYFNLGDAYQNTGRVEEAFVAFATALRKNPSLEEASSHRLLGTFELSKLDISETIACAHRALERVPDSASLQSVLAYTTDFDPSADAALQQAERKQWYRRFMEPRLPAPMAHPPGRADKPKLRIGYIPGRFYRNASCYAFAPMLLHYDRSRFEVYCYSSFDHEDDLARRIRGNVDGWRDIAALNDEKVARMIHVDGIDILVDLFGHAGANRLPIYAWKPAPIQVTAWGHANGTGMPRMDYLFSDPVSIPDGERHLYAETVLDLPCQLSYWRPEDAPPVAPLPALKNGWITFGCFNRSVKVTDEALDLWARLLSRLPRSRLLLKDAGWSIPDNRARIERAMRRHGVDPDRVSLLLGSPWYEHLAAYAAVDIALDTLPMGGGVTTLDALWMGTPVICIKGDTLGKRITSAIMTAAGMADWVAESPDAFMGIALGKSADAAALAILRERMRERIARSPLANPDIYVRMVEHRYREMWQKHCGTGDNPRGFAPLGSLLAPGESGLRDAGSQAALATWSRFLQETDGDTLKTL